jgi:hypothetical protein
MQFLASPSILGRKLRYRPFQGLWTQTQAQRRGKALDLEVALNSGGLGDAQVWLADQLQQDSGALI